MGMSELLSFREEGTNSGEMDLFCSALTRLAIFVATTFSDLLTKVSLRL